MRIERGALRVGRLFGIDVFIDWSWSFIFLLMTWNLTDLFRRGHPSWDFESSIVLATLATLLFFASVVAHELAHSLVARSYGIGVRDVRLFLFGGVSSIEREPPSPGAELWIAIVGPLVSFGLAVFFLGAAFLALPNVEPMSPWETLAALGPLPALLFWLGPINIMVGVFNLVPGFPLDGGRVLRAILWKVTGDLRKATRTAAIAGRALGWTFIAMGIAMTLGVRLPFFGQGALSGLWLAFIGWLLSSAAESSYVAVLVQEVLEGVRVARLMQPDGRSVPPTMTVDTLVNDGFMRSNEHAFPVVDEAGGLLGLVSVDDIHTVSHDAWGRTSIATIMTPREHLVVAEPADDVPSVLRKLAEHEVDQLPVLEGERLAGMLSRADVARWLECQVVSAPVRGMNRGRDGC